jgi:hypothetical protein
MGGPVEQTKRGKKDKYKRGEDRGEQEETACLVIASATAAVDERPTEGKEHDNSQEDTDEPSDSENAECSLWSPVKQDTDARTDACSPADDVDNGYHEYTELHDELDESEYGEILLSEDHVHEATHIDPLHSLETPSTPEVTGSANESLTVPRDAGSSVDEGMGHSLLVRISSRILILPRDRRSR